MNLICGPSIRLIAGVDEAGRGPLAGPVIASAVILDREIKIEGLADSKTLSATKRTRLAGQIKQMALDWTIARAEHHEIDSLNILQASLLAMQRAISGLKFTPDQILVDGNHTPVTDIPVEAVIKGDQTIPEISAASILAKVCRDEEMLLMDSLYPGYGFARHKGYPTRTHLEALKKLGACEIHRRSYRPVRSICG